MLRIDFSAARPGRRASSSVVLGQVRTTPRAWSRMAELGRDPVVLLASFCVLGAFLGISGLHLRVANRRTDVARAIQQQVRDSATLAGNVKAGLLLKRQDSLYTASMEAIRDLDRGRFVWPHVLAEINAAVPPGLWLLEVSESRGGTAPVVVMRGAAVDPERVTMFLSRVQLSPFFSTPRFVGSDQEPQLASTATTFTIEAQYREPADSARMFFLPLSPVQHAPPSGTPDFRAPSAPIRSQP